LSERNPPTHPELLDELAAYFVETGFDVRNLLRTLANTRAYQLTSRTTPGEHRAGQLVNATGDVAGPPLESLARMPLRTLTAEQFYDSLVRAALSRPADSTMYGPASPGNFNAVRQQFVAKLQSQRRSPLDYDLGVVQVLLLMNGPEVSAATGRSTSGLVAALEAPIFSDQERIEAMFLATLTRLPSDDELTRCLQLLSPATMPEQRKQALGDIFWSLANSAEFTFNH